MSALPADLSIPPELDRRLNRGLIYTYTLLNAYRNCGHAMYRRYIKKDQPYVESPEMKWGNDVHLALELRVAGGKVLPLNMQQFESFAAPFHARQAIAEQKLGMTKQGKPTGFWDTNCWFRGKVDVTLLDGNKAGIWDWKTGSSKFEDPFELETNALLLKAKYPELTFISGSYIWLKEKRIGQNYNLSRFRQTWDEINRLSMLIEADRARNEFEKKRSGLCGWCSVSDCENWQARK